MTDSLGLTRFLAHLRYGTSADRDLFDVGMRDGQTSQPTHPTLDPRERAIYEAGRGIGTANWVLDHARRQSPTPTLDAELDAAEEGITLQTWEQMRGFTNG